MIDGNFQSETRTLKCEATTQNVALAACHVNHNVSVTEQFKKRIARRTFLRIYSAGVDWLEFSAIVEFAGVACRTTEINNNKIAAPRLCKVGLLSFMRFRVCSAYG